MKPRNEAGLVQQSAWLAILAFLTAGPWASGRLTGGWARRGEGRKKRDFAGCARLLPAKSSTRCRKAVTTKPFVCLPRSRRNRIRPTTRHISPTSEGSPSALGGHRDAARELLRKAAQLDPKGRWVIKIRYELAGIELASGNWAPAEELAPAEAERLLAGDRKDQLAGIYHEYARRLLEPGDPLDPCRPERRLRSVGSGS